MFNRYAPLRWAAVSFVGLVLSFASTARAQDYLPDQAILVLTTTAPGAPSASDIVNYYYTPVGKRPSTPPLQGLTVGNPQIATYLIPLRAQGDFLARLQASPNSPRAKLERYVVVYYPGGTNLSAPRAALQADPYVAAAYLNLPGRFSSASLTEFDVIGTSPPFGTAGQYGREDMNIDAAWALAGGYALVQVIDSGLHVENPALRQFSGTNYVGGNFIPIASLDVSTTVDPDQPIVSSTDVDERRAMPVLNPFCNPDPENHPDMQPVTAGHGTHTSGLIAANGAAGLGVEGTCKNCGLAMWKTAFVTCGNIGDGYVPVLFPNPYAWITSLGLSGDIGAQVASMSWGSFINIDPQFDYCTLHPEEAMCLAITEATYRDVALVAASGNDRTHLDFPAMDPRVLAAGGYEPAGVFWDEWPNCPLQGDTECGSNWTAEAGGPRQELVASAKSVLSTTYANYNWSELLACGDQFPGPSFGGGIGLCTGTSMSAPQISGVLGLLRSTNPIVPFGASPTTAGTLRSVLASTASRAAAGLGWDAQLGYGLPDAAAAVRKMLGKVARAPVRNRATPLFRLRSTAANGGVGDYADTTSPQTAMALMINTAKAWVPVGPSTVPNYPQFPHGPDDGVPAQAAPQASVYVLTTEVRPRNEWPDLVPLYSMSRLGASGGVADFMLVTTKADIEYAHSHDFHGRKYDLRNIQGYIYKPCAPQPGCIPPGALPFYRACNAGGDCAAFLSTETGSFSSYTTTFPPVSGSTRTLLGYAYPATDTDQDGLPNGFELAVGTDPAWHDSDRDGIADRIEMPLIGVPTGDPCFGGTGALYCGADVIFRNGFDFP